MIAKLKNQIINGDCLEVLSRIEDETVDVCFADPPFNLNKKYTGYADHKQTEEYLGWCRKWITELVRVTKPTGSIFIHNIPKWLTHYACILNEVAYFRHWIAWDAMSAPLGKTLLPAHYGILMYTKQPTNFRFYEIRAPHKTCRVCSSYIKDYGGKKDQMHPFGGLVSDVWTDIHRIRHSSRRDKHPCQLPIHLLERVILMSSEIGDVILDPFSGTGTTAIAAKTLQRNYIGIEQDEFYAEIAKEKIEQIKPTMLEGIPVSVFLGKVCTVRDVDARLLFGQQLTSIQKKLQRSKADERVFSDPIQSEQSLLF